MLNPNFKEMLCALNDAGVEYLVVGAYALAAHGWPRATGDLDIWLRPTVDNASRVCNALRSFGAPVSRIRVEDFSLPDVVYQIGVAPQRIDLLTSISGVDFDKAWADRITVDLGGLQTPVIGRADLICNKLATGRPKDLLDAESLSNDPGES